MPHDLQRLLNWYLNPWARLRRKGFNAIIFIAFLPTLIMQVNSAKKMADNLAYDIQKMAPSGYGNGVDTTMQAKQMLATLMEADTGPSFTAFLPYIIYALLVPIILMRLRDSGMDKRIVYIIFAPIVLDVIKLITGFEFGTFFTIPLIIASFVLLTVLSIKGSVVQEPSPHIPVLPPIDN